MSALAWQRGTLTSVSLALFCIQLDFLALTLALPTWPVPSPPRRSRPSGR